MHAYRPILTAKAMQAAEQRVIDAGASVQELMERAGAGVAKMVHRLAAGRPVLVLCGPGNNGGDGYVAARILREMGARVRVCALAEPRTEASIEARRRWGDEVEHFPEDYPDHAFYSPVVVDALLGTGATRPFADPALKVLSVLVNFAQISVAVDLPSGLASDDGGRLLDLRTPGFDVTLALGALKPAHVLYPAAEECGTVEIIDIGLGLDEIPSPRKNVSADAVIRRPVVLEPRYSDHKYSRGMVVVLGGAMCGASLLSAEAALRAGAGYALLLNDDEVKAPAAVVQKRWSREALDGAVAGKHSVAIVVGPGLGRDSTAEEKLEAAIACKLPLLLDGDALHLLDDSHFTAFRERRDRTAAHCPVVLTPHAGEFEALFGKWEGSKIEAARQAAIRSGAIVVFKGPDTVVAHPDGMTNVATGGSPWLSTAGTGDVLAGIVGAMIVSGTAGERIEAGVWLHAEAAKRLGGAFIADDLVAAISGVRASL